MTDRSATIDWRIFDTDVDDEFDQREDAFEAAQDVVDRGTSLAEEPVCPK